MRLKITHALSGSIDGIQLSHFVVGHAYEVGTSLASFLLAIGAAESESDERAAGDDGCAVGVGAAPASATKGSRGGDPGEKRRTAARA